MERAEECIERDRERAESKKGREGLSVKGLEDESRVQRESR